MKIIISTLDKTKLMLLLVPILLFLGCSREGGEAQTYTTPSATNPATPLPLSMSERITNLIASQRYWITATPTGDGRFGYFIGASDTQAGIVSFSFAAGTNVLLLEVSNKYCKVEGLETAGKNLVQGWIVCERLANFEPTPVPDDLYIHSP